MIVLLAWCLSGMLLLATVSILAATVMPDAERAQALAAAVAAGATLVTAAAAILLGRYRRRTPDARVFRPKVALWTCLGLAVAAMLLLVAIAG